MGYSARRIVLFVERIFDTRRIFHPVVSETVGNVSFPEPVLVEVGRRETTHPQTGTLDGVTADGGVHGAEVKLAQIFVFVGLDISRNQYLDNFFEPVVHGIGA